MTDNFAAMNLLSQVLKVIYGTFQKRQQPLILFNVLSEIRLMLQATNGKMIPCCDTEEEIVKVLFGKTNLKFIIFYIECCVNLIMNYICNCLLYCRRKTVLRKIRDNATHRKRNARLYCYN
jgi:hypothetical protein